MQQRFFVLFLFLLVGCTAIFAQSTYVIVHGAWGGAWQFKKTALALQEKGHTVYRPTLSGLGERHHLMNKTIDLTTHIKDVVNIILFENLDNVILVGHSYGGMVITGVADSIPERIKRVVYLDALVPDNGESALESLGIDAQVASKTYVIKDDALVPTWVKNPNKIPRDVPHPLATMTSKIVLKNKNREALSTTYVFTYQTAKGGKEKDDFYKFYLKAKSRSWKVVELEASHNPQVDKLTELVTILDEEQ